MVRVPTPHCRVARVCDAREPTLCATMVQGKGVEELVRYGACVARWKVDASVVRQEGTEDGVIGTPVPHERAHFRSRDR